MSRFFVIVDKRDFKKLMRLVNEQENAQNQKFWAFSQKDSEEFQKIKKEDLIYFCKEGFASWQCVFKVSQKGKNSNFTVNNWGNDLRSKNASLVIHLEDENYLKSKEPLPYIQKLTNHKPGIYKIPEIFFKSDQKFELPEDLHGIPEKRIILVKQTKRDTKKVQDLKNFYEHKCQICLERIEIGDRKYYSEVHHLRPIGSENGEDDFKNMIVVCPTHHKAFDYCSIRISLDGKNIVNRKDKLIKKLFIKNKHLLSNENIVYQFYRKLK
jgi:hypothetical protein